ncbi:hypothetical protein GCK32_001890 [Trichostrongylus colubriformis]|uniref:Uncharacterized protein n=1 Tax=Trichostrongylus colubriformis TaxID=6319 RepID=A0AAN8ET09_TRICO
MMLMVLLSFIVSTHSFARNQSPTTPASSQPRRDASTHAKGPAEEYDALDDLSRHVFGDTVSNLQKVFVADSQLWFRSKPEFGQFHTKWQRWSPFMTEEAIYTRVFGALYDAIGGKKTRTAAKAHLIDGWLSVPESTRENLKMDFSGFNIVDDMAHGRR